MKKLFLIIILCLFLSACNKSNVFQDSNTHSQEKEANLILSNLLTYLENNDTSAIKDLFADNLIINSDTLDNEIQQMVEYFDGKVISYKKIGTVAGEISYRDGKVTYSVASNAHTNEIVTDSCTYKLSFAAILVNDDNKASEGLWRIWIGKSDNDYLIIGSPEGTQS